MIIHLGYILLYSSCDLPEQHSRQTYWTTKAICCSYLVLHQMGFTLPRLLPNARCALTAPFHPYPKAVSFLWHFP